MQPEFASTQIRRIGAPWETARSLQRAPNTAALGSTRTYRNNQEIFAEGDRPDLFYKVVSGAVRVSKLLSDGRRHIGAFHLPGDIFGVEAGAEHRSSAEALGSTTVVAYARSRINAVRGGDGGLQDQVLRATVRSLERAQTHMVLLGRKSAMEKMATFLLDISERLGNRTTVQLPMSRADIADHLGLTIETVSRSLTQLQRQGIIEIRAHRRGIALRDRAALWRLGGWQSAARCGTEA